MNAKITAQGLVVEQVQAEGYESVQIVRDAASGLEAIVSIHNTALGSAFGGCRLWTYDSPAAALTDALRLSRGMTYKNAMANLPCGGGKAVILRKPDMDRDAVFAAFGNFINSLGGQYVTAEDVGTTVNDMLVVREQTPFVSGIAGHESAGGDPSPLTALGVFLSIQSAVSKIIGRERLHGTTVAVQGLGSVGMELCRLLSEAGCELVVADITASRVNSCVKAYGAKAVSVDEILFEKVDVLAPCALGGVLNAKTTDQIKAKIIAGAANNQLATIEDGDALHARGVVYLPDYLVNAGGIISVYREYESRSSKSDIRTEVGQIADRVIELLDRMTKSDLAPARITDAWAQSLIAPQVPQANPSTLASTVPCQ